MHIHVLSNGEVVYHSHVFKKIDASDQSNQPNHTSHKHTKKELLYLHLTTVVNSLIFFFVLLLFFFFLTRIIFSPVVEKLHLQNFYFLFSNRAPPVSVLS